MMQPWLLKTGSNTGRRCSCKSVERMEEGKRINESWIKDIMIQVRTVVNGVVALTVQ